MPLVVRQEHLAELVQLSESGLTRGRVKRGAIHDVTVRLVVQDAHAPIFEGRSEQGQVHCRLSLAETVEVDKADLALVEQHLSGPEGAVRRARRITRIPTVELLQAFQ